MPRLSPLHQPENQDTLTVYTSSWQPGLAAGSGYTVFDVVKILCGIDILSVILYVDIMIPGAISINIIISHGAI